MSNKIFAQCPECAGLTRHTVNCSRVGEPIGLPVPSEARASEARASEARASKTEEEKFIANTRQLIDAHLNEACQLMERIKAVSGTKTITLPANKPEDASPIPDAFKFRHTGWPKLSATLEDWVKWAERRATGSTSAELVVLAAKFVYGLGLPTDKLSNTAVLLEEYALVCQQNSWERYAFAELAAIMKSVVYRRTRAAASDNERGRGR